MRIKPVYGHPCAMPENPPCDDRQYVRCINLEYGICLLCRTGSWGEMGTGRGRRRTGPAGERRGGGIRLTLWLWLCWSTPGRIGHPTRP